jgi:hypothetical protein
MPTPDERKWLASWKIAEAELQRIGREELANLSDELAARQATYLGVDSTATPATDSGLRQWQQLMERLRRRSPAEQS